MFFDEGLAVTLAEDAAPGTAPIWFPRASSAEVDSSCAALCAEESLLSLGCDAIGENAACLCTSVGTPCEDEAPRCADAERLLSCAEGVWAESACAESCAGGSCEPSAEGAACVCP